MASSTCTSRCFSASAPASCTSTLYPVNAPSSGPSTGSAHWNVNDAVVDDTNVGARGETVGARRVHRGVDASLHTPFPTDDTARTKNT